MGGARDATNVISGPDLAISIITTVGEEHLDALGGSLESIAVAKSGIIKNGRPVRWSLLHIAIGYMKMNLFFSGNCVLSDVFCLVYLDICAFRHCANILCPMMVVFFMS